HYTINNSKTDNIQFRMDTHNINLHHRGLLSIPQHNTTFYERSFSFNIAKVYNSIPESINALSVKIFKKQPTTMLL
ncbi:hypothetical protein ILUMI_16648, partial [Ignelater luminosus]